MEYTRPATWDDVKTLVGYLNDAGVEYARCDERKLFSLNRAQ